jgi:hypothetical protein
MNYDADSRIDSDNLTNSKNSDSDNKQNFCREVIIV